MEQDMIEDFAAPLRRGHRQSELFFDLLLADEISQSLRAQGWDRLVLLPLFSAQNRFTRHLRCLSF
jgi:hypothetical protein